MKKYREYSSKIKKLKQIEFHNKLSLSGFGAVYY